jgi:surface protein
MRDENYFHFRYNPDHDGGIRTAVRLWCRDPAAAKARYGPIASWDTSSIAGALGTVGMFRLFHDQAGFNEDISRWNVSNVVNMAGMFDGATSFNGDLSRWDVSNVVNMSCMFADATSFNGDLSRWNVSNVVIMNRMFAGATSFDRQLDGAWSTSTASKLSMFLNSPGTITGRTT